MIDDAIAEVIEVARSERPELEAWTEALTQRLREQARDDGLTATKTSELCAADLLLAIAAQRGDRTAIAEVSALCEDQTERALRRYHPSGARLDDIRQEVLSRLFVGGARGVAKIGQYAGRGPLRAWLRVIALREAWALIRSEHRELVCEDEAFLDQLVSHRDPNVLALKRSLRPGLRRALAAAIADLSIWDRELLAEHIVTGRAIAEIALGRDVHRATVARWLAKIRAALQRGTMERLEAEHGAASGDLDSAVQLVLSSFDPSLERLLDQS